MKKKMGFMFSIVLCIAITFSFVAVDGNYAFSATNSELDVYDAPAGVAKSDIYEVNIIKDGVKYPSFVYVSKVPEINGGADGANDYRIAGRTQNWTTFSFSGKVTVEVIKKNGTFNDVKLRPTSYGLNPVKSSDKKSVKFDVDKPGQKISVEFDGNTTHSMMVFADPMEDAAKVPSLTDSKVYAPAANSSINVPSDKSIVYFKPGVYDVSHWKVPSQVKQVYIAGGAVVYGAIDVSSRNGFIINGRGVLTGEKFPYRALEGSLRPAGYDAWDKTVKMVKFQGGSGQILEGITIANAPHYNVAAWRIPLTASNVKILGNWRFNNDGFDVPQNSLIEDCFISPNDDAFKLYHENSTIRRCVIWQMQNGAVFQLGWFNKSLYNSHVSDIDVIHMESVWYNNTNLGLINFASGNTSTGTIKELTFENINMEGPILRAIGLKAPTNQTIKDITIKNLKVDEWRNYNIVNYINGSGKIENITFENMTVGGQKVTDSNKSTLGKFNIDSTKANTITFKPGTSTPDDNNIGIELIENPGFEAGTTGWSSYNPCKIGTVSSPVKTGSNALKVSERKTNWTGPRYNIKDKLITSGKGNYSFEAMLRSASGAQQMYMNICIVDSSGKKYFNSNTESVSSNEYKKVSGSANLSWTGDIKEAYIYTESNTGYKSDYYVDDFSLKKAQ